MKTITIPLEDLEHERLSKQKAHRTWKEALIQGCHSIENQ